MYVLDALDACARIFEYTAERDLESFLADSQLRSAVERQFITVGEALQRAAELAADADARIGELREIVGFRHVLVHGYSRVEAKRVWDVLTGDLPGIRSELEAWLRELDPDLR